MTDIKTSGTAESKHSETVPRRERPLRSIGDFATLISKLSYSDDKEIYRIFKIYHPVLEAETNIMVEEVSDSYHIIEKFMDVLVCGPKGSRTDTPRIKSKDELLQLLGIDYEAYEIASLYFDDLVACGHFRVEKDGIYPCKSAFESVDSIDMNELFPVNDGDDDLEDIFGDEDDDKGENIKLSKKYIQRDIYSKKLFDQYSKQLMPACFYGADSFFSTPEIASSKAMAKETSSERNAVWLPPVSTILDPAVDLETGINAINRHKGQSHYESGLPQGFAGIRLTGSEDPVLRYCPYYLVAYIDKNSNITFTAHDVIYGDEIRWMSENYQYPTEDGYLAASHIITQLCTIVESQSIKSPIFHNWPIILNGQLAQVFGYSEDKNGNFQWTMEPWHLPTLVKMCKTTQKRQWVRFAIRNSYEVLDNYMAGRTVKINISDDFRSILEDELKKPCESETCTETEKLMDTAREFVVQGKTEAKKLLEAIADRESEACFWLGYICKNNNDLNGALKYFLSAAEGGYVPALLYTADAIREADSYPEGLKSAAHYLSKASEMGLSYADRAYYGTVYNQTSKETSQNDHIKTGANENDTFERDASKNDFEKANDTVPEHLIKEPDAEDKLSKLYSENLNAFYSEFLPDTETDTDTPAEKDTYNIIPLRSVKDKKRNKKIFSDIFADIDKYYEHNINLSVISERAKDVLLKYRSLLGVDLEVITPFRVKKSDIRSPFTNLYINYSGSTDWILGQARKNSYISRKLLEADMKSNHEAVKHCPSVLDVIRNDKYGFSRFIKGYRDDLFPLTNYGYYENNELIQSCITDPYYSQFIDIITTKITFSEHKDITDKARNIIERASNNGNALMQYLFYLMICKTLPYLFVDKKEKAEKESKAITALKASADAGLSVAMVDYALYLEEKLSATDEALLYLEAAAVNTRNSFAVYEYSRIMHLYGMITDEEFEDALKYCRRRFYPKAFNAPDDPSSYYYFPEYKDDILTEYYCRFMLTQQIHPAKDMKETLIHQSYDIRDDRYYYDDEEAETETENKIQTPDNSERNLLLSAVNQCLTENIEIFENEFFPLRNKLFLPAFETEYRYTNNLEALAKGAALGGCDCAHTLGNNLYVKDLTAALKCYRFAASRGNISAILSLSKHYMKTAETEEDLQKVFNINQSLIGVKNEGFLAYAFAFGFGTDYSLAKLLKEKKTTILHSFVGL